MKNVLVLHGTDATSHDNWFPWLKEKLEENGHEVWVPNLPHANRPNISRYNKVLLSHKDFVFNEKTIIIGHSSGAVAILGLLQALPNNIKIDKAILVAGFINDLGWDSLSELFERSFDYEAIKQKANKFILLHSDNDPYVPLDQAKILAEKLGGELLLQKGEGHFSEAMNSKYKRFPLLLELL